MPIVALADERAQGHPSFEMTRDGRSRGVDPSNEGSPPVSRELVADARPRLASTPTLERLETLGALETGARLGDPVGALPTLARLAHHLDTEDQIGHGAMSRVYSVFDHTLLRRCAMKVLAPELESDRRARVRFVEEAQITGQLDHPNIVTVHALGVLDSGALGFTMKLVEGATLAEKLRPHQGEVRRPDWIAEYLEIFVKVCDAVAFAHDRGVIHRDLKPDNVIVGPFGQVYLMDWGVAALIRSEGAPQEAATHEGARRVLRTTGDEGVDRDGMLLGTVDFMAPEQARGELSHLDARSDIYALGALLYWILAGRTPCEHVDRRLRLGAVQRNEVEPLDRVATSARVPARLRAIAMRALSASPGDRYSSVIELKNEVLRFARGAPELPTRTFPKGAVVVREGETNDEAYVIREGTCQAYKTIDGERIALRTMGSGDVFGELSVVSSKPCTASVEALEELTVQVVDATTLRDGLGLNTWVAPFVAELAERFREVDARLTAIEHPRRTGRPPSDRDEP